MKTKVYDSEADTLIEQHGTLEKALVKANENEATAPLGTAHRMYWKAVASTLRRRRAEAMAEKRRNPRI